MSPPAEDPNYVTQTKLGLAPALWPGQDELGFAAEYQTMPTVCPTKEPCGQLWPGKKQVYSPCPHSYSVTWHPNLTRPGAP